MSTIDGRSYDPSALLGWARPLERIRAELHCLGRLLMPGDSPKTRSAIALLLVGGWLLVFLNVQIAPDGTITMQPDVSEIVWLTLTAIVFALVGQMWHLERVDAINGLLLSNSSGQDQDQDRARHPSPQRDVPEDYRNPGERRKQTEDYPDDDLR